MAIYERRKAQRDNEYINEQSTDECNTYEKECHQEDEHIEGDDKDSHVNCTDKGSISDKSCHNESSNMKDNCKHEAYHITVVDHPIVVVKHSENVLTLT